MLPPQSGADRVGISLAAQAQGFLNFARQRARIRKRHLRNRAYETRAWVLAFAVSMILLAPARSPAQPTPFNSLALEWTAPGDDGMTGRASFYRLRYSTSAVGGDTLSWWNAANEASGLPTPSPARQTDSTRVTGLRSGSTYYFMIRAYDEAFNESPFSNVAIGATASCDGPTAAPQSFAAVLNSTGSGIVRGIQLSWSDAPADTLVDSVRIYRGIGSSGSLALYLSFDPSVTSFLDAFVSAGTTYRYRAAWASQCGAEGPTTSTISVSVPGTPAPPPAPVAGGTVHVYPVPARDWAELEIEVTGSGSVAIHLALYDITGHLVARLVDGAYAPGSQRIRWSRTTTSGDRAAPGYYEILGTVGATRVRERTVLLP